MKTYGKKEGNELKQKTKKYLGRVYKTEKVKETEFSQKVTNAEQAILDIVVWELKQRGFEQKRKTLSKEGVLFNITKKKVYNSKGNNCAIAMNEGYLTSYGLRKLINFKPIIEEDGYELAKMFVECGLAVPANIFVDIFAKLYK